MNTCKTCKDWHKHPATDNYGACFNLKASERVNLYSDVGIHCLSDFGCIFYEEREPVTDAEKLAKAWRDNPKVQSLVKKAWQSRSP